MLLRPRQTVFVERSLAALEKYQNTLGVAPTGAGKTIMLSGVAGRFLAKNPDTKACVLAHRDELTEQNNEKFLRVNPTISTSVMNAQDKSWEGRATFAMVQTLSRDRNLQHMPALDLLIIDEAHHAASDSYRRVIDTVRDNNHEALVFGVTATPNRGDRQGLRPVFDNVADHVTLGELIQSGHLVPPKTRVIDVGTQDALSQVATLSTDFDMSAVGAIMNTSLITESVILHWREHAGDRPTIIFCSTIAHANDVAGAFNDAGVSTEVVHGELTEKARREALARYESGDSQVIVNVAVLTEGYDHPPTSCVILLRPSSYQSTMIQMIGRGLRTVDPEVYPGITKADCVVLDFGTSSLMHGSLEQSVNLDGHDGKGESLTKDCPECEANVPLGCRECPLCGFVWPRAEREDDAILTDFIMSEVDLLKRSSFQWCDLYRDDGALMATGFEAWAGAFFLCGHWYSVGGRKKHPARLLGHGDRTVCIAAADDWLNAFETEDGAQKSRRWLSQPATESQLKFLASKKHDFGISRYHASCLLAFKFNKRDIHSVVFRAAAQHSPSFSEVS